jgi:hypothetical protein
MSWLFSRALVEEYSGEGSLGGEPCAQLNLMPTRRPFSLKGKTMVSFDLSQYGVTSKHLTESRGEELLMSFLAGFHAKTSAQLEKEQELPEKEVGSGWKWRESSVKYDPAMRLWKTRQCLLLEDSEWFSETWPRWGTLRDGECWELPMSARPIFERGSGLWRTPTAEDCADREFARNSRGEPKLSAQVKLFPTPTASAYGSCQGGSAGRDGQPNRPSFPTPRTKSKSGGGIGLDGGTGSREKIIANLGEKACKELTGGSLNPTWVEWLMGWPLGWTDLQPWVTDKCHSVPPWHGNA